MPHRIALFEINGAGSTMWVGPLVESDKHENVFGVHILWEQQHVKYPQSALNIIFIYER
jgi:hypothetical protein